MTAPLIWRQAVELEVDFCIWVLIGDGLRVPPFDMHAAGSGELQALGLAVTRWRDWLDRVVGAQLAFSQRARTFGHPPTVKADDHSTLATAFERLQPPSAWIGSDSIRARLREMWIEYQPQGDAWRRSATDLDAPGKLTWRDRQQLWRAADRERTAGRMLNTYLVRYLAPVVEVVRPDTIIVAVGPRPTAEGYLGLLREGIRRLEKSE